ncbi:hypothetical protein CYV19_06745 [Natronobacterium gregoryi SP2]|uniref:Uncharacterized protein n=1 Tax=Natronobacterium gregoryi (strain ATCC 43098 / DSM 3393 / CCM 3738 / CIP 104747 / IAM 13177 / JCM 8860 / NBRC 102187 / NCIMB 2189 / SP2) TaxID=797304 RepID=L9YGY6_NATGS|nr:hypothetical protein C490_01430 [Natronobacterium gregoryi SP2]PLK20954.1 hypothetical protein CYV19_06745 [Natronobacterium gregoryi SP2]
MRVTDADGENREQLDASSGCRTDIEIDTDCPDATAKPTAPPLAGRLIRFAVSQFQRDRALLRLRR